MSYLKKLFWPGLLTILLVTAFAVWLGGPTVQQDLGNKVVEELKADHPWANVSFEGRDLFLSGTAPTQADLDDAVARADAVYDVRVVSSATALQPVASPYVFKAEKTQDAMVLTGSFPRIQARETLSDIAEKASDGRSVEDNTQLASGAPDNFNSLVTFALERLGRFETGEAEIDGQTITVSGLAKTSSDYDAILSELEEELPENASLGSADVLAPEVSPYRFRAEVGERGLRMSGFAPSIEKREALAGVLQSALPDTQLSNRLSIAAGEPENFDAISNYGLQLLTLLETGEVAVEDKKLSISGSARSPAAYRELVALMQTPPAGAQWDKQKIETIAVMPYRWRVSKRNNTLTMFGQVPSAEVQQTLSEAIEDEFELTDKTEIATGEPRDFGNVAGALVEFTQMLDAGEGNLVDTSVSIVGRVASQETADAIASGIEAALPEGYLSNVNVVVSAPTAPETSEAEETQETSDAEAEATEDAASIPVASPYRWSISRIPTRVTLLGNAPSEDAKQSVSQEVASILGVAEVDDRQVVASGAPDGFEDAQRVLTRQLKLLEGGQASIVGNRINLTGRAKNANLGKLVERSMASKLPDGFEVSTNIAFPKPEVIVPEANIATTEEEPTAEEATEEPVRELTEEEAQCEMNMVEAVDGRKIGFDTNRATILSASTATLDAVKQVADECPNVKFEVVGHTDSQGKETFNQDLSEARAQAVVRYLVDAGIERDRLVSKGLGETMPIASNETPEGRATNRRIEFKVLESGG